MHEKYIDLKNLSCVIICSIIIILTPIVFDSAAYLNYSYALRDPQTTATKYNSTSYSHHDQGTSCNCVVFRMDDLQDYWIRTAQITGMNLFLSKHIPLTLAVIMNSIGNDSQVVGKIREGSKAPDALFELAIHGWNHVNYAGLSEKEQADTLKKANDKMLQLFGNKSNIFITPYGPFNADTIKAMDTVGIQILSSALVNEERFDGGASISYGNGFSGSISRTQYAVHNNNVDNNNTSARSMIVSDIQRPGIVYHLPAMSLFYDDESGKPPIKTPIEQILVETKNNIKKYGYSVIVFHPQDFVERDDKGNVIGTGVSLTEVNDLSSLIDSLVQERIPIVHFSTLVKYINNKNTQVSNIFNNQPLNCSSGWQISTYFTPVETDFNGSKETISAINGLKNFINNTDSKGGTISVNTTSLSSISTFTTFLNAVQEYGWGKTKDGSYLGYYDNKYYIASHPENSIGTTLKIGDIAVDPSLIPLGTKVKLPALKSPWNNMTFTASDTGISIKGKHVGVYVGEGKVMQESNSFKNNNNNNDVKVCY
jgi:3D (Asp-Asp-Asp) domain-containing protein/peptidoglycan/xylan/chitin deacetylase (PgdA/CDA1 family)